MASPLGHSLVGTAVARGWNPSRGSPWAWYALALLAANAPDLDFLPGLIVGDINRFHHGFSHSLAAALVFGAALTLAAGYLKVRKRDLFAVGTGLYLSHLLLDAFTYDGRPPAGVPLLWPASDLHVISPWTPFQGVKHADPGDSFSVFVGQLFSWHNVRLVLVETALLGPLLAGTAYWRHRRERAESMAARLGTHEPDKMRES